LDQKCPLLQIENDNLLSQIFILFPCERASLLAFLPEIKKPAPFGAGFLLDVVPPGPNDSLSYLTLFY